MIHCYILYLYKIKTAFNFFFLSIIKFSFILMSLSCNSCCIQCIDLYAKTTTIMGQISNYHSLHIADCYTYNILAAVFTGLLQVFFVIAGNTLGISDFTLYLNHRVDYSHSTIYALGVSCITPFFAFSSLINEELSLKFPEGYRLQHKALKEGWRVQQPKCEYSNQNEYSHLQCVANKNALSQRFSQMK